jgi:hypothetical protein
MGFVYNALHRSLPCREVPRIDGSSSFEQEIQPAPGISNPQPLGEGFFSRKPKPLPANLYGQAPPIGDAGNSGDTDLNSMQGVRTAGKTNLLPNRGRKRPPDAKVVHFKPPKVMQVCRLRVPARLVLFSSLCLYCCWCVAIVWRGRVACPLPPSMMQASSESQGRPRSLARSAGGYTLAPAHENGIMNQVCASLLQGGGRSGAGSLHRPHTLVKWLSLPVVIALIVVAAVGLFLSFNRVIGPGKPVNYSLAEILASRDWCSPASVCCMSSHVWHPQSAKLPRVIMSTGIAWNALVIVFG